MKSFHSIQTRYQLMNDILNRLLNSGKTIQTEALAEYLKISKRQVWTDIKYFQETLIAPLAFDRRQNGWYYTEPFIFIDRLALSRDELYQLDLALKMLTQEEGLARRFGQLTVVAEKVRAASRKVEMPQKPEKVVFFAPQPDYAGAKYLPFFLEAIENSWKTAFDYKAYSDPEPRRVAFDPYFLKQWDGRWYAGGQAYDPLKLDFIRVYPLERIVGQPVQDGFFHDKPVGFSAESYWANIYGITDPKEDKTVEDVVLRFEGVQKRYFLEAPFFPFFKILEDTETSVTVLLHLKINIELKRKIASYGHELTVLGPPRLVGEMHDFFKKAMGKYG